MSILLMWLMASAQAAGQESLPDPALLEMLGAMADIEELGVDIDRMIEQRLDTDRDDENQEPEQ